MDNGLVTSDGTKVLTVAEYDQYVNFHSNEVQTYFELNTITSIRYVALQRPHDHEDWNYTERIAGS